MKSMRIPNVSNTNPTIDPNPENGTPPTIHATLSPPKSITAIMEVSTPMRGIIRRSLKDDPKIARNAYGAVTNAENVEVPDVRGGRSYSTPIEANPSQAQVVLRNLTLSGSALNAVYAARETSRKSLELRGIGNEESAELTR